MAYPPQYWLEAHGPSDWGRMSPYGNSCRLSMGACDPISFRVILPRRGGSHAPKAKADRHGTTQTSVPGGVAASIGAGSGAAILVVEQLHHPHIRRRIPKIG